MVARRKATSPVSPAQRAHAQVIMARFGLTAPEDALDDPVWVGNLLDVFSFDADRGQGGYRALRSLVVRCVEGCDADHIARVIGVSAEAVRQAVQLLRAAGYDLDPVEEDPAADPEDEAFARQERAEAGAGRDLSTLLALSAGETPSAAAVVPVPPTVLAPPPGRLAAAAWRFLVGADYPTRRRWSEAARRRGAPVGPAATARENIHLWVAFIAADLAAEERL